MAIKTCLFGFERVEIEKLKGFMIFRNVVML